MQNQHEAHGVPCEDAIGRSRAARVFPVQVGRVGIQAPPGEVMVLTIENLHRLWVLARETCQTPSSLSEMDRLTNAHAA